MRLIVGDTTPAAGAALDRCLVSLLAILSHEMKAMVRSVSMERTFAIFLLSTFVYSCDVIRWGGQTVSPEKLFDPYLDIRNNEAEF